MEKNLHKTTVYLPDEIAERIKQLAKEHQRSFNSEIVWALKNHIKRSNKKRD